MLTLVPGKFSQDAHRVSCAHISCPGQPAVQGLLFIHQKHWGIGAAALSWSSCLGVTGCSVLCSVQFPLEHIFQRPAQRSWPLMLMPQGYSPPGKTDGGCVPGAALCTTQHSTSLLSEAREGQRPQRYICKNYKTKISISSPPIHSKFGVKVGPGVRAGHWQLSCDTF